MKNILVPTDFSAESHYAFEAAVRLAQHTGGQVTLLHTVELPDGDETANFSTYGSPVNGSVLPNSTTSGPPSGLFVKKLLQVNNEHLHQLMAEAAEWAPAVVVQELMRPTSLNEAILTAIGQQHADLVVMGAQPHTATEHFFSVSNTERLMRTAPCPVLVVKHPVGDFDVKTLVFASDFLAEMEHVGMELLRIQALFPAATLHLLQVVEASYNQPAAQTALADFAQRHQLGNCQLAVEEADNVAAGIERYAQRVSADLLLLPTHGHTGLSRLFHSGTAEEVATQALPPVLTLRPA
ncbi:universal stress protein [Hymenobacter sp. UV11]|uniref:universal stress protein n=1 Tax=Hymenobacter sp. UV11 TaxID=1849735 RepID=UPI00105F85E3|nr:universal stress protein [Hymenobacter sp. UV11]TDN39974.1 hypothetical protein A8B98_16140 [Hymenobacter sp. UV11]TFZ62667.1 universal stress protein [Hymenobacter sp. UV11]